MKTLIIKDNIIVNIAAGEPKSTSPQGLTYEVVPDDLIADLGWIKQNNEFIDPKPPVLQPASPTPEWLEFNTTLLTDPDWLATADLLLEGLKIALYSNASSGNTEALQTNLAVSLEYLNSINKPISQTILNKWQNLANLHHIPITFTNNANL